LTGELSNQKKENNMFELLLKEKDDKIEQLKE